MMVTIAWYKNIVNLGPISGKTIPVNLIIHTPATTQLSIFPLTFHPPRDTTRSSRFIGQTPQVQLDDLIIIKAPPLRVQFLNINQ